MLADAVASEGGNGGGGAEDYIFIRDEKTNGTNGGTFTLGSWQTRDLNSEVVDGGGHASVSSNQITLAAGTYRVKASAPAHRVDRHKLRLRNITDSVDLLIGSSERTYTVDNMSTNANLIGQITLDDTKVIELQHRSQASLSTYGLGVASSFSVVEVYAQIEFWKKEV